MDGKDDKEKNLSKKDVKGFKTKFKEFSKTRAFKVISYVLVFFIGYSIGVPTEESIESAVSQDSSYETKLSESQTKISELEAEVEKLEEKVEEAKPWFEMKEEERKAEEEKLAKEKEEKEKAEQAKKEAEEKKGYNTGITYSQLARTPDDYKGKKVKFSGKVVQVMEGDGETQIRLAVGGSYDNIIYGVYSSSIVDSRILEDDYITVYGTSSGLLTYTSTMGGEITIPSMLIQKIDQ